MNPTSSSGGGGAKIPVLFGLVAALAASNGYLFYQNSQMNTEIANTRDALLSEVAKLKETSSVSSQSNRRVVDSLKDELARAQRAASSAAGEAKIAASRHADEVAAKLKEEQEKQAKVVKEEINKVAETASTANTKIGEVSNEVSTVKSDVASTKSELEKTIADLRRTTGDLGVQSGLIATNSKELQALRALGERNYLEFTLSKSKQAQKVGDIALVLKKVDPKKNKYTIDVLADDKSPVEKKDKGVNEPVQFYTSKAKQPYELVVNSVKKDQIAGYLSTPKVQNR